MDMWEQDLLFRDAFRLSCVPCYQEVARTIGTERMNDYQRRLDYGTMVVDTSTIDQFWLTGDSRINQFQQIDFLQRLYEAQLPISPRTEAIVKRMMVIEDTNNYRLSGKTGWSTSSGTDNGWFVGYVEKQGDVYFFATNIEPTENLDIDRFIGLRASVTTQAFQALGLID